MSAQVALAETVEQFNTVSYHYQTGQVDVYLVDDVLEPTPQREHRAFILVNVATGAVRRDSLKFPGWRLGE